MIVDSVTAVESAPIFIRLVDLISQCPIYLKLEGLNIAGSIKLKTARQIVRDLETTKVLEPGREVIESSSGNLGLALAMVCAERRYPFTCVTDPNVSPATERIMKALGARVIVVQNRDAAGGFLKSRLDLIASMVKENPRLVWTNQYANSSNPLAHFHTTGPEILKEFPAPSWVFAGAGTTGTITGCARFLRDHAPRVRIIAVDPVGSVTFGGSPGARYLPGIGTSSRPELADESVLDGVTRVPEEDAVRMCRHIAQRYGLLLGASTGSVLSAVCRRAGEIQCTDTVIAISPDFGDRYVDTLFNDDWVNARLPAALRSDCLATAL